MQILFLAHRLPYPPNKGDKIRSFWELRTLAQHHDVDLACFYDDREDSRYLDDIRRYCRSCYVERISALGSRMRALSALVRGRPFSTAFYHSSDMARHVADAVHSRFYDLIFVFSSSMAQYAEPWLDIPKILDLVDVDSEKWIQYARRSSGFRSWLWKREGDRLARYESALVSSFYNTLVCTDAEARLLRHKALRGRISVLQNWLDSAYFAPESVPIPAEIRALQPYVVFTGSMDYLPNVDAVRFFSREVLPAIHSRVPNLRFVIAGRNPTAEVTQLSTNPAVLVTGTLPDIRPYLRGAAAAVAPMRIARGVQNKILEALAMGIPVISSSLAASALPAELASLLLVADEPGALTAGVLKCLQEVPQRRSDRRAAVVQYVEKLDLPSQLDCFLRSATGQTDETTVRGESRDEELVSGPL